MRRSPVSTDSWMIRSVARDYSPHSGSETKGGRSWSYWLEAASSPTGLSRGVQTDVMSVFLISTLTLDWGT